MAPTDVQQVDLVLVHRQAGLGGEHHHGHGGPADQGHDDQGHGLHQAGQAAQIAQPHARLLHRCAGHGGGQALAQGGDVHGRAGGDVDQRGQGQVLQQGAVAQPGLHQAGGIGHRHGAGVDDAGHAAQRVQHHLHPLIQRGGGAVALLHIPHRADLDGQAAVQAAVPALRPSGQQLRRRHRQGGQEDHQGDQPGQETARGIAT
ncbi:hypothetical protein AZA_86346 [Nitrospirillum viridazoti Y2]|nr:hypothetical protein AZA_86346 [Nitrospirillum amazonense Y2]